MNIKVLIFFALLISTLYIYYTVQQDKDRIYQTLYQKKSNPIQKSVTPKKQITTEAISIKTPPIKTLVEKSMEKRVEKEEKSVEKKVFIVKKTLPTKKDTDDTKEKEDMESIIAQALKGITTSQIIKTGKK